MEKNVFRLLWGNSAIVTVNALRYLHGDNRSDSALFKKKLYLKHCGAMTSVK